jgi:hypothetical protein
MPSQNCWCFYDRRTNPTTIHRFSPDGQPAAVVIHVLKEAATDGYPESKVVSVIFTSAGNAGGAITHLPTNWESADWSNHQWPRGHLFVWENEYPNPHEVLAAAQNKRLAAEADANKPPVETDEEGNPLPSEFHPADVNQDRFITKVEKHQWEEANPGQKVEKGPY